MLHWQIHEIITFGCGFFCVHKLTTIIGSTTVLWYCKFIFWWWKSMATAFTLVTKRWVLGPNDLPVSFDFFFILARVRPSYLYNGNLFTDKMASLYWGGPLHMRNIDIFAVVMRLRQYELELLVAVIIFTVDMATDPTHKCLNAIENIPECTIF